jgi:uncharacterized protein
MSEKEREPYERMTEDAFNSFEETSSDQTNYRPRMRHQDVRTWSLIAHLSGLAGYIIPFGMVAGPLLVWLLKRHEMPIVGEHARRALNFQLTVLIGLMISIPLMFVFIGIPLMILIGLAQLVFTIVAAIKVNEGEDYRYPFSLELVK